MKPSLLRLFLLSAVVIAVGVSLLSFGLLRERYSVRIVSQGMLGSVDTWLLDEAGSVVASTSQSALPQAWETLPRPSLGEGNVVVKGSTPGSTVLIRRASSDKPLYFLLQRRAPGVQSSVISFIRLVLPIVLLTSGLLTLAIYLYSRRKAAVARGVMGQLKAGNLRARFPVDRLDEIGSMMLTFNEMAEQIERLVTALHAAERSRNDLLRSLAHDLRTPLTSLGLLIESAANSKSSTPRPVLRRKMQLAHQELSYFKRLLEDLFVLSNLDDPLFVPTKREFDPREWTFRELDRRQQLALASGSRLEFFLDAPVQGTVSLSADAFLFERAIRNALDNAEAHARERVWAVIAGEGQGIVIDIRDDGPGFADEVLAAYGRKHHSRFLDASKEGRISMGLGSLIMQRIVSHFGGSLAASNWTLPDGRIGGASVRLHLPARVQLPQAA